MRIYIKFFQSTRTHCANRMMAQETQRASYVKHAWRRWRSCTTAGGFGASIPQPPTSDSSAQTHLFLYFAAPYFSPYHESEAGITQTAEREINFIAAKGMYVTFQSITDSSHLCSSIRHISYPHKLSHSYGLHFRSLTMCPRSQSPTQRNPSSLPQHRNYPSSSFLACNQGGSS